MTLGALAALAFAGAAHAAPRTFVKSTGSDSNPCSLSSPCRFFQAAVDAVDPGGEVVALDSASYGRIFIRRSVTIAAPRGVHAVAETSVGTAIRVEAGADDVVVIRGLVIRGLAGGSVGHSGIALIEPAALHVEGCVISDLTGHGISAASGGRLFVKDTIVRNVGSIGLKTLGPIHASVEGSRFESCGLCGVSVARGARAAVHDSDVSLSEGGFCVSSFAQDSAELSLRRVTATGNTTGVSCQGSGAVVRAAEALVTGNGTGLAPLGGCTFESLGNNLVRGNATNVDGSVTLVGGQ